MAKKLQELLTEIATKSNAVNDLFDAADKRGDGVSTKDEIDRIKALNKEIEDLEKEAADTKSVQDIRDGNAARLKDLNEVQRPAPFPGNGNGYPGVQGYKSIGQQVLENPEMAAFLKQFAGTAGPSTQRQIQSPVATVDLKTLVTGAGSTSGGPFVNIDYKPIVDVSYARPLTVRDIITVGETTSDTVEYVRITGVTNNAAGVAEATATGDGSGAKPESGFATEAVTAPVINIAHWVPATTRALRDAGVLRTYIDSFLRYGINEEEEDQILVGSGVGQNFTGIMNTTGTSTQSFTTDMLTTIRKARTKVRTLGRARPTAIVMHPNDWETADLLKDNEARYYFGGPTQMGTPRLWGLPVVESEGMTEGFCIVADFKLAVLWERQQISISMSNSHSDFFVRNMVAILAEKPEAFGVIRPAAFVETDIVA